MSGMVSVIIPVYNAEKYLNRCVESVVAQSYEKLEIILVDDGSQDRSTSICQAWQERDPRVKVICQQNEGAGIARNRGMAEATGQYIFFVDSDDYLDGFAVEKCVSAMELNTADAVVYGAYDVLSGGIVKQKQLSAEKRHFSQDEVRNDLIPSFFVAGKGIGVSVWGKMYRTDIIQNNRIWFESERIVYSEDALFNLKYFSKTSSVILIPEYFYYHYENMQSISRQYKKEREDRKNEFLIHSIEVIEKEKLPEHIKLYVQARYHAFVMASLKQIMTSDLSLVSKIKLLNEEYNRNTLRESLKKEVMQLEKKSMKLFYELVKWRLYPMCNLMLWYKIHFKRTE